jgi:hypothetical protein
VQQSQSDVSVVGTVRARSTWTVGMEASAWLPAALFRLTSSLWFTGSGLDLGETLEAAVAVVCGGAPHCVLLADCFGGGKENREGLQLTACAAD